MMVVPFGMLRYGQADSRRNPQREPLRPATVGPEADVHTVADDRPVATIVVPVVPPIGGAPRSREAEVWWASVVDSTAEEGAA